MLRLIKSPETRVFSQQPCSVWLQRKNQNSASIVLCWWDKLLCFWLMMFYNILGSLLFCLLLPFRHEKIADKLLLYLVRFVFIREYQRDVSLCSFHFIWGYFRYPLTCLFNLAYQNLNHKYAFFVLWVIVAINIKLCKREKSWNLNVWLPLCLSEFLYGKPLLGLDGVQDRMSQEYRARFAFLLYARFSGLVPIYFSHSFRRYDCPS